MSRLRKRQSDRAGAIAGLSVIVWLAAPVVIALGQTDALSRTAQWQAPSVEQVERELTVWLAEIKADDTTTEAVLQRWNASVDDPLLDRLVQSAAMAEDRVARLIESDQEMSESSEELLLEWTDAEEVPKWLAANLRLYLGRRLIQRSMFDEAAQQLADLEPEEVVDPAALLFYQSVAAYQLLDKERGLERLDMLLAGTDRSPRRFVMLAGLMQAELEALEPDSLDHIARRMQDIERRLELGRAGSRVREIEDGVIESLDKLIEKAEQQRQQSSSSGAGSPSPSTPADDSRIMGGKGAGQVTKKSIGTESGWGSLPPKEREQALQEIGRQFPAHYRDTIEQYFRQLANEESE